MYVEQPVMERRRFWGRGGLGLIKTERGGGGGLERAGRLNLCVETKNLLRGYM